MTDVKPASVVERISARTMRLACVFITMGERPDDLARAIASVRSQSGDPIDIVLVAQGGGTLPDVPDGIRVVELDENIGIPAGRNVGWKVAHSELGADAVLFVDDDGWLATAGIADRIRELFASDPKLGIVSLRIADPETGDSLRRHVPRVHVGNPAVSSDVTTFVGAGYAVRRPVLDQVGPLPDIFFYAHEETDLAWRALDAGWRIHYAADCVLYHPATSPTRHAVYYRFNARNRVWLARRHLPAPLAVLYLANWVVVTLARYRGEGLRPWLGGFLEGLRTPCGPRRPIRWRTAWRMARLGRPPLI